MPTSSDHIDPMLAWLERDPLGAKEGDLFGRKVRSHRPVSHHDPMPTVPTTDV
jgi:hypothetical protein